MCLFYTEVYRLMFAFCAGLISCFVFYDDPSFLLPILSFVQTLSVAAALTKSSGTHLILTTSSYLRSSNRHGYLPSARSVSSSRNESQMSIVLTCWIDTVMPTSCDLLPSRRYQNWTLPSSPFPQLSKAPPTVGVKVSPCCNWHSDFCY